MSTTIHQRGACVGIGADDLFFSDDITDQRRAQAICVGCSVRIACLESALSDEVEFGVWGGVIFWDGVAWLRRRGRGRPRQGETSDPISLDPDEMWAMVRSA